MQIRSLLLSFSLVLPCAGRAELHEFTDTSGRKITAEILNSGPGWINVRRQDGHKFLLTLDKLSAEDKAWVADVQKKQEKDAAAQKRAVEVPAKILAYCREHSGKQVGNGECWTLADECFKACELKRPGGRVWGRKLDPAKEKPQPGDIVEFRSAKFADGGMTGPEHTAIVVALGKKGHLTVAEQNWGGHKTVHERDMDPAGLKSGEMMFYRPE
ncbi:MAG TPA: CHAP domain-containing protein [Verrucomicrobiales bacterium]|nr:CHAP domain-containing protein [Verrucomicrobiales bacterium]